jgi:hypothetical protein
VRETQILECAAAALAGGDQSALQSALLVARRALHPEDLRQLLASAVDAAHARAAAAAAAAGSAAGAPPPDAAARAAAALAAAVQALAPRAPRRELAAYHAALEHAQRAWGAAGAAAQAQQAAGAAAGRLRDAADIVRACLRDRDAAEAAAGGGAAAKCARAGGPVLRPPLPRCSRAARPARAQNDIRPRAPRLRRPPPRAPHVRGAPGLPRSSPNPSAAARGARACRLAHVEPDKLEKLRTTIEQFLREFASTGEPPDRHVRSAPLFAAEFRGQHLPLLAALPDCDARAALQHRYLQARRPGRARGRAAQQGLTGAAAGIGGARARARVAAATVPAGVAASRGAGAALARAPLLFALAAAPTAIAGPARPCVRAHSSRRRARATPGPGGRAGQAPRRRRGPRGGRGRRVRVPGDVRGGGPERRAAGGQGRRSAARRPAAGGGGRGRAAGPAAEPP